MRKLIFSLAIIVLLAFTGIIIYKGTNIGNFEIWGVKQISEKNEEIDQNNERLTNLVNVTYPAELKTLNEKSETLQQTKKEYEEQAILQSGSKYYKQTEKYKVEFIWTKLGNYAKDNNVNLDLDFKSGSASGLYDIDFKAIGKYADVAQFIYDIENDSKLGFKIEDFNMNAVASTTEDGKTVYNRVQGNFTCKDIRIEIKSVDQATTNTTTTNTNTTNTTNENTSDTNTIDTNTTNSVDTENTTNTTNTVQ